MLSLDESGTFQESFFYGYPYDAVVVQTPPEFDYVGAALTSAGTVVCTPGEFTMHYGSADPNPDVYTPYGGAEADHPYYMRFPVMSWNDAAGIFLTVTTTDEAVLTFDRSFSGYVGDRLSVVVNDQERVSITGSAGYPWTTTTVPLGMGVSDIAILLKTAPYTSGVVREGVGQTADSVTDLFRYLRLCNLQITNVVELPTAEHQATQMLADSSCTLSGTVEATTGQLLLTPSFSVLALAKNTGRVYLTPASSLTLNDGLVQIGRYGNASLGVDTTFDCDAFVYAQAASDGGGFGLASTASLTVEDTNPQDVTDLIRPLKRIKMTMTDPVIISGRPTTPIATCAETVTPTVDPVTALVLDKLDPFNHVLPDSVGGLTYRWLSLDAERNVQTHQLTKWKATDPSGPTWTNPGARAYTPAVEDYVMRRGHTAWAVHYPSVQFDSGHMDHLTMYLPVDPGSAMTWVFVGSFARFRGALADSCPIFDYATDARIDYNPVTELKAVRGSFPKWTDDPTSPSVYLGLTSYGTADPATSRVAYRKNDSTAAFGRTDGLVITDNTPVVIVYVLNGASSYAMVTPLTVTGSAPSMVASLPRTPLLSPGPNAFCLGKARTEVPYGGDFLTGSMNLLEVAYASRALTQTQASDLSAFYASLYAPVSTNSVSADFTTSGGANQSTEQVLVYAGDPETPLALISGSGVVPLGVYPSDADGQATITSFRDRGIPIVLCSNRDYESIIARMEME